MALSDAQKRANAKWDKENTRSKTIKFTKKDFDILDYLESQDNQAGFIKQLIREHMEAHKQ